MRLIRFLYYSFIFLLLKSFEGTGSENFCEKLDGRDFFEETDKICFAKNISLFLFDNYDFVCLTDLYVHVDAIPFILKIMCNYKDVIECLDIMENKTVSYTNIPCNNTITLKKFRRVYHSDSKNSAFDESEDVVNGSHVSNFKCRVNGATEWQTNSFFVLLDADIEIYASDDVDTLNCSFVFPQVDDRRFESKLTWKYQNEVIKQNHGVFSVIENTHDGHYKCQGTITFRTDNVEFTSSSSDFYAVKQIIVSNRSDQKTSKKPPIYTRLYIPMKKPKQNLPP